MVKDFFKYIPLTTIVIVYLYVCGGLYLIGYWSTFGIDISNIVSLTDIPKSFIYPFLLSNLFFIIQLVVAELTSKTVAESKPKIVAYNWRKFIGDMLLYACSGVILIAYTDYKYNAIYWGIACLFFLFLLAYKFGKSEIVHRYFPVYNIRYYVGTIFITVPIFCVLTAKFSSLSIYNNTHIRYAKIISNANNVNANDTLRLKLLGFLGDKIIVSSLNNKKIEVLNQSSFDGVQLEEMNK